MLRSLIPSILLLCHLRAPLAQGIIPEHIIAQDHSNCMILLHPNSLPRGRMSLQVVASTQVTPHMKVWMVQPACACRQPLPKVRLYFSAAPDQSGKCCLVPSDAAVSRVN